LAQLQAILGCDKFLIKGASIMATNFPAGDGHRNGAVKDRSQTYSPKSKNWVKRDSTNGQFMDQKADSQPFKGVRKEK
jgi:hypothetical protein